MIWICMVLLSISAGRLFGRGDAEAHVRFAEDQAPVPILIVLSGVIAGFYGRDRVRLHRSYASPSAAYAGKFVFFVSLSAAASWVCTPLDWPAWTLAASAAGCAAGATAWLGNLPQKL